MNAGTAPEDHIPLAPYPVEISSHGSSNEFNTNFHSLLCYSATLSEDGQDQVLSTNHLFR